MTKLLNAYLKVFLVFFTIVCCSKIDAQVSPFSITAPTVTVNLGDQFEVYVDLSWTPATTSTSIRINFDNNKVVFVNSPVSCLNVSNTTNSVTLSTSNLGGCVVSGSGTMQFPVRFRFIAPDTCTGVTKLSTFTASVTDNINPSPRTSTTVASGILNNNVFLSHTLKSYNSINAEVTFRIYYNNGSAFRIINPSFNINLSPSTLGGTITSVFGQNYNYTHDGFTITPTTNLISTSYWDYIDYVVKLPCTTLPGSILASSVTMRGKNCDTLNTLIKSAPMPDPTFTIPIVAPASVPNVNVTSAVGTESSGERYFKYRITNTGNAPLNLTANSYLPLVHVYKTRQNTDQSNLLDSIQYFNCASTPSIKYILNGNNSSNTNAPLNSRRLEHSIYNLQQGKYVELYTFYDTTSSCNGSVGSTPFRDSVHVAYNCVAPSNPCVTCGPGGVRDSLIIYNPSPNITCDSTTYVTNYKNFGDTITLTYKFKNTSDGALLNGIFRVPLPNGIKPIRTSFVYSGFITNPNPISNPDTITGTNIEFRLDTLRGNSTKIYRISFRAVIGSGVLGGEQQYWTRITGTNYSANLCGSQVNINKVSKINISKKVKGNLDANYSSTGSGAPNENVNYQLKIYNKGTTNLIGLEVIDRIPQNGNKTIKGDPTSNPIPTNFPMQMLTATPPLGGTVSYTNIQNPCTGWTGAATDCNAVSLWSSTLAQGAVKFKYSISDTLHPGDSLTLNFQTKIPAFTPNGYKDCNTAGFFATAIGAIGPLYCTESDTACITVINPCPPVTPAFTSSQACANGILNVTATSTFTGTANHQWSLMQASSCGTTNDVGAGVIIGAVQTTQNALFSITNFNTCYYIKHRVFSTTGCIFDTTFKLPVNLPASALSINANLEDSNGVVKDNFCVGENVYLDGSASTGETQYTIQILRKPAGSISSFAPYVTFTAFTGSAGVINLTQLLLGLPTPMYFESQYEYSVTFTISNPGTCTPTKSTKIPFKIYCCDGYINANFQLSVVPTAGNYTLSPVIFNSFAAANPTHEWYVLSSPLSGTGPYTPVFSTTAATFSLPNAQYNLYYSVIHKIKTNCGEECIGREQYQSTSKSTEAVFVDCCLATQYWANGAGTEPQSLSAEFEIGTTPLGGGQYSIDLYPTYDFSANTTITHEWFVLSSPNTGGGPYTAVAHSTDFNYNYSPANDGLYYFIIHKVKSPCGEVCYGQSTCRNCGGTCSEKCEMCGVIDCRILDGVWPACYPPINLVNKCRGGILSWDAVPAANSYEVELDYNDPNCCNSSYDQVTTIYSVHVNSLNLNEFRHPKYDCIRWRVRANCERGVVGEWSEWSCYYCNEIIIIDPLKSKSNTSIVSNSIINSEPKVSPNPNNGEMNLQMQTKGELTLSIDVFNTQGILVKSIPQNKYPDGKFMSRLNLGSNTPKGLYLVVFKTNVGTFSKKVIIN